MKALIKIPTLVSLMILISACNNQSSNSPAQVAQGNIYGGTAVEKSEWRSTVAIGMMGQVFCSGVLINKKQVLSAGHCGVAYRANQIKAYGQILIGSGVKSGWEKTIAISNVETDPRMDLNLKYNSRDFSLFTLAEDAPEDIEIISPITKEEAASFYAQNKGQDVTLVGFGVRENGETGEKYTAKTKLTDTYDSEYEAGLGDGKGTCHGDSGGPSFAQLPNGEWRIIGITSRGPEDNGTCFTYGGVYGRVDSALGWVEETGFYQDAIAAFKSKDYGSALASLAKCSSNTNCLNLQMTILRSNKNFADAIKVASKMIEIAPQESRNYQTRAQLYDLNGDTANKDKDLERVKSLTGLNSDVANLAAQKKYSEAIADITNLILATPDVTELYFWKSRILLFQAMTEQDYGIIGEALTAIQQYISLRPNDPKGYQARLEINYMLRNIAAAQKDVDFLKKLAR